MAFAFFRRRQKTVIIVMVILMVSFLVGFQGFSMFFTKKPGRELVGTFGDGTKLRQQDVGVAYTDLRLLARGRVFDEMLDAVFRVNQENYRLIESNRGEGTLRVDGPELAYTLLLHEAEGYGPVTDVDIDSFLANLGITGETYQAIRAQLRSDNIAESRFRGAVANLILLNRSFYSARAFTPPSEPEMQALFRDFNEQVAFEYVAIPAAQFLDSSVIIEPSEEEIEAHFAEYAGQAPGRFSQDNPYGFGYRMADQVSLAYLYVDAAPLQQAVVPSMEAMWTFYNENTDAFMTPAELDEEGNVVTEGTTLTFVEAYDPLLDACRPEATRQVVRRILRQAEQLVADYEDAPQTEYGDAYTYALANMALPADGLLERAVTINIADQPLDEALAMLAELVGIQGISYPLVDADGETITMDTPVSLSGEMTLADALAELADQLDQPETVWVQCAGLAGPNAILFANSPVSTFPVSVGQFHDLDRQALESNDLLGDANCRAETGSTVSAEAFSDMMFAEGALAQLHQEHFPQMQVGSGDGELIWRVTEARSSYTPELDDVRAQVIEDIKLGEAMREAQTYAQSLLPALGAGATLADVAAQDDLTPFTVDLLARRGRVPQLGWVFWNRVDGLALPGGYPTASFFDDVMALAQAQPAGVGGLQSRTGAVRVPAARQVCLVRVLQYVPADADAYQLQKPELMVLLLQQRMSASLRQWVSLDAVESRVGFEMND